MYRIVVFDDHPIITKAILSVLVEELPQFESKAFNTTPEVLDYLAQHDVHYLISDLITNETAGIDLINKVVAKHPEIRIIVYSSITNDFIIESLKRMGVLEFVSKSERPEIIAELILENSTKPNAVNKETHRLPSLTSREKSIINYLVEGKSSKEISHVLGVSVNTVNNQKNNLLKKYDCANSVELIAKLSKLGYINFI